jgi:hypothetical protein
VTPVRPLIAVVGRRATQSSALRFSGSIAAEAVGDAVLRVGGEPVIVHGGDRAAVAEVPARLARFDGVCLPGGGDVSPARYGQAADARSEPPDDLQDEFDLAVIRTVLGITGRHRSRPHVAHRRDRVTRAARDADRRAPEPALVSRRWGQSPGDCRRVTHRSRAQGPHSGPANPGSRSARRAGTVHPDNPEMFPLPAGTDGSVAFRWGDRPFYNRQVTGSNPVPPTGGKPRACEVRHHLTGPG